MKIEVLTLFPEMFEPLNVGILGKAQQNGLFELNLTNIRDYSLDKHKKVDDTPFGGGAGMVMQIEPIDRIITHLKSQCDYDEVIYTSPDGETFNQRIKEIMSETSFNPEENLFDKIKYICSFNAVDHEKQRHFVEIIYALKIDEGNMIYVDTKIFKFWKWMTMEDIKNDKLFFGFEKFIEKFKVKEIKDILKIKSV